MYTYLLFWYSVITNKYYSAGLYIAELVSQHLGKFVLIKDSQIIHSLDTILNRFLSTSPICSYITITMYRNGLIENIYIVFHNT